MKRGLLPVKRNRLFHLFFLFLALMVSSFAYSQTIRITGQLLNEKSPVDFGLVKLSPSSRSTFTNQDGFFTFDSIPSDLDSIQITCFHEGKTTFSNWIHLPKNATIDLGVIHLNDADRKTEEIEEVTISHKQQHGNQKAAHADHHNHGIGETNYIGANQDATQNVADDIKKMTSIHVGHDHEEGNELSARGTPWDWNMVLLDGVRLPIANSSGTRSMSLSVIPNSLINYLDASKSSRPDLPGDAIGGIMNIITKDESDSLLFKINISGGYNFQAQQPLINGNFILSNSTKNKRWGYVLGANLFTRNTNDQAVQIQYFGEYGHSIRRFSLQNNNDTKGTYSALLGGFYQVSKKLKISYKALGSINTSASFSRESRYDYSSSLITSRQGFSNAQTILLGGKLSMQYDPTPKLHLELTQSSYSTQFYYPNFPYAKGDGRNGDLFIDFTQSNVVFQDMIYTDDVGNSYSSDVNGLPVIPNGVNPVGNLNRYKYIDGDQPANTTADSWKQVQPQVKTTEASSFQFDRAFSEINHSREIDPIHLHLSSVWKPNNKLKLQSGISFTHKTGERKLSMHEWYQNNQIQNSPILLSSYELHSNPASFLNKLPNSNEAYLLPALSNGEIKAFIPSTDYKTYELPMTVGNYNYRFFSGSNYAYKENYGQAYTKAIVQLSSRWSMEAGLRVEHTHTQITVDTVLYDNDKLYLANVYETGNGEYSLVPVENDPYSGKLTPTVSNTVAYPIEKLTRNTTYSALLPMVNFKFDATKKTVLRASLTRSYRRPVFEELKPGQPIIDYNQLEYTLGNPNLKPAYAWNVDFTSSTYLPHEQLIEFGVFAKRIDQLIFKTVSYNTDQSLGIRTKSYENSATPAYLVGAEFNFRKLFSFLPGIWEDLGIELNGAATYSQFQVPGKTFKQALPNQPNFLSNIQLFFDGHESGIFVLVSASYTGDYTTEINTAAVSDGTQNKQLLHASNPDYDQFIRHRWEGSFYGEYTFKKGIYCYVAVNNIFNSPHQTYRGNEQRMITSSYDGLSVRGGLKYQFYQKKKKSRR